MYNAIPKAASTMVRKLFGDFEVTKKYRIVAFSPSKVSKNKNSRRTWFTLFVKIQTSNCNCTMVDPNSYNYIMSSYNSNVFWNHTGKSAQWRALCTKITEVNYLHLFTDCFMKISLQSSDEYWICSKD